jgi:hypothetical protein
MTTATIVREAEIISRAQAILDRAEADAEFPWASDEHTRKTIRACAEGVGDCLEEYADLTATPQRAHPASVFPDLGHHQDNALEIALERVAEDARLWAGALVLAVREQVGDQIASRLEAGADEAAAIGGNHDGPGH